MNKIFENWRSHLRETSDEKFLDELESLLTQWSELQTGYGNKGENILPNINVPFYGINQFEDSMREIPTEELKMMLK